MAVQVRCPHCKEVLYIERSEFDIEVLCPRCKRGFVWRKVLEAKERERRELKERRRKQLEERRRRLEERRRRRLEERQRRREEELWQLMEVKYSCETCGKPLCEKDIIDGEAVKEDGKVYCKEHLPKLRKCPACGRDVSRNVPSCPHCGEPLPIKVTPEVLPRRSSPLVEKYYSESSLPLKATPLYPAPEGREYRLAHSFPRTPVGRRTFASAHSNSRVSIWLGSVVGAAVVGSGLVVIALVIIFAGRSNTTTHSSSKSLNSTTHSIERTAAEQRHRWEAERRKREELRRWEIERRRREERLPWANPISVSAEELYQAYDDNAVRADAMYKGKVLRVSGEVTAIGRDIILGIPYVCLAGGKGSWVGDTYMGWGVQCAFRKGYAHALSRISKGDYVTVIGICLGKAGITPDVVLVKCRLSGF